jgi:methionyl-tRNA synthetase
MVTNYFLKFEGKKCSTSRKHGIWLHEILSRTSVTADELRYYLSHTLLESGSDNFVVADFVDTVNRLRSLLNTIEADALTSPVELAAADIERLHVAVHEQGQHLQPGAGVSLSAAVAVLDRWLTNRPANHDVGWWHTGLALLAEPFMPALAQRLWVGLGRPGRPHLAAVTSGSGHAMTSPPHTTAPLTTNEINRVTHIGSNRA